jgi:hypothetical protein
LRIVEEIDINSALKTVSENNNILAKARLSDCELKKHEPRFDKEYSKLLYGRKRVKLQWCSFLGTI